VCRHQVYAAGMLWVPWCCLPWCCVLLGVPSVVVPYLPWWCVVLVCRGCCGNMLTTYCGGVWWCVVLGAPAPGGVGLQVVAKIGEIHAHGYLMHQMQGGVPAANQHLYVASQYRLLQAVAAARQGGVADGVDVPAPTRGTTSIWALMARYIIQSINFMDCVVWCYWQAIDATPRFSIVTIKWHPRLSNPHTKLKKFWVWKQMIKFIQPGSLRIIPTSKDESEHCVAAFYDPNRSLVSFNIANQQARTFELTLHLEGFNTTPQSKIEVYRMSLSEDFVKLDVPEGVFARDVTLDFAPRSLTTVASRTSPSEDEVATYRIYACMEEERNALTPGPPSRGGWSGPPPRAQTVPQTVHMQYGSRTHRMRGDTAEAAPAADQSPLTNESGQRPVLAMPACVSEGSPDLTLS